MAKFVPKITRSEINRRSRNRSKAQERAFARFLFAERRTPLSGGMSGHTRCDVIDSELYAEAKGASVPSGTNGWIWRWLLDVPKFRCWSVLTPIGVLSLQHVMGLGSVRKRCRVKHGVPTLGELPKAGWTLWRDTVEKAGKEQKTPLVGLRLTSRQGWWLLGEPDVMERLVDRGAGARASD